MSPGGDATTGSRAKGAPAATSGPGAPSPGRDADGASRETPKLTGEALVERMTSAERERAARVESVLPLLREHAASADQRGEFHRPHVATLREAGLLGLIVPEAYGGLGGTLRDLAAATFAMGSACPSTALAWFFHCSSASRGLLALEAIEAGLFSPAEVDVVKAFAERLLFKMGKGGCWLANFASETVKTEGAAVTISTEATPTRGGFLITGEKSFGCSTGVADEYLVTAKLAGHESVDGLALFFVNRDAEGVAERHRWDAIGMRATATHGITLRDVFVAEDAALAVPGAFTRMMRMSRGSFVGNQLAATAVYAGAAWAIFHHTLSELTRRTFSDTGRSLGSSPFHSVIVGDMAVSLETAMLWLRRQLELETSDPPLLSKADVVRQWRFCKGEVAEAAFRVAEGAFKAAGTSGTGNTHPATRALRDMAMGLVQAFPAERGRLEAASMLLSAGEQSLFGVKGK
jgi:alkylation response protein AidB-like acyl-CoA dehydrogenase